MVETASLEQFVAASREAKEAEILVPATTTYAAPPSLVHGSQQVVVLRDEARVLAKMSALAAAAGDAWYYSIPFKDRRTGKTTYVEGPTIKLANDIARIYGNCDVDAWVSSEGIDYWEITSRFIDLESGYSMTRVFRQRKDAAKIGGGSEAAGRNMEASFSTGTSKAIRNVICNALQTFADFAYEEARNALVRKIGSDIEKWRREVPKRLTDMGIDTDRVERVVGRSVKDWLAPDIAKVTAMAKAIKDGMASADESFPPVAPVDTMKKTDEQLDEIAEKKEVAKDQDTPAPDKAAADEAPKQGRTAPKPAAAASDTVRDEAIKKLLALALDEALDVQARLEAIDMAGPTWEGQVESVFLNKLIKTAVQVARGYMSEKDAYAALK